MIPDPTRRTFIRQTALIAATGWGVSLAFGQETSPPPAGVAKPPPKPPALPPEKVQAAVGVAHRSLEKLRALLDEYPLIANASWDWGGGDFETPLQAAAHTGGRQIAEYLLSKNARLDIYGAGMLGHLEFIKAAFAVNPHLHEVPGPHGFTLLHCVKQGGADAQPVYDFLLSQGVPMVFQRPLPFVWPAGTAPGSSLPTT
ncbi:MAG: hypothetical protein ABIZ04_03780 [Opitutus sp.]